MFVLRIGSRFDSTVRSDLRALCSRPYGIWIILGGEVVMDNTDEKLGDVLLTVAVGTSLWALLKYENARINVWSTN